MVRCMSHKRGAMTSKAMHGGEFLDLRVTEVETPARKPCLCLMVSSRPMKGPVSEKVESSPEG